MTKYSNVKTEVDGYKFDSRAEATRYCVLKLLQNGRQITDLVVHPVYPLRVADKQVGKYIGDFEYRDINGHLVTEDVKGVRTAVYRLKAKMFKAQYSRDIVEIEA